MFASLVGEPCAYEGSYVAAHPVDPALYLSHDPSVLNDVSFRKHVCPKALADASRWITVCF
jgi:hypothetical protein